jgi:hypothetical protein
MPVITPKSPEVLQAQAAAFAAEHVGYGDGRDLAQEIGNASVGMQVAFDTPPSQREWAVSSQEKEYLAFLRENGGQENPDIARRAEMILRYADFEPVAEEVLQELDDMNPKEWHTHPNHIGAGGRTSNAFVITHQGQDYALRVPRKEGFGIDREYIAPAIMSDGDTAMEQMVAVSYNRGVTVSELVPGRTLEAMSPEAMAEVSEEHVAELVDTLARVHEDELLLDPNPGNVLYDAEAGFGVIDLADKRFGFGFTTGGTGIDDVLNNGAKALLYPLRISEKRIDMSDGAQADRNIIALYSIFIPIIGAYKTAALERFAEDKRLPLIEKRLDEQLAVLTGMRNMAERSLAREQVMAA